MFIENSAIKLADKDKFLNTSYVNVHPTLLSHSLFIIHLSTLDIQSFLKIFSNRIMKAQKLLVKTKLKPNLSSFELVPNLKSVGKTI